MIPKYRSVLITNLVVHYCTHLNKKIDMLKYKIVLIGCMVKLLCPKCLEQLDKNTIVADDEMTYCYKYYCMNQECENYFECCVETGSQCTEKVLNA